MSLLAEIFSVSTKKENQYTQGIKKIHNGACRIRIVTYLRVRAV